MVLQPLRCTDPLAKIAGDEVEFVSDRAKTIVRHILTWKNGNECKSHTFSILEIPFFGNFMASLSLVETAVC